MFYSFNERKYPISLRHNDGRWMKPRNGKTRRRCNWIRFCFFFCSLLPSHINTMPQTNNLHKLIVSLPDECIRHTHTHDGSGEHKFMFKYLIYSVFWRSTFACDSILCHQFRIYWREFYVLATLGPHLSSQPHNVLIVVKYWQTTARVIYNGIERGNFRWFYRRLAIRFDGIHNNRMRTNTISNWLRR